MPNWSYNHLQIVGSEDEIDKFLNFVKTKESAFDFDTIIPEAANNPDGEMWRWEHWGTNKIAFPSLPGRDTIDTEAISTGVEMWFETAWRPPLPVLLELSKKFPALEFQ